MLAEVMPRKAKEAVVAVWPVLVLIPLALPARTVARLCQVVRAKAMAT